MKTLQADDMFQLAIKEITEQQIAVFVNADSTTDEREEAHNMICAIRKIDDYFDSVKTDKEQTRYPQESPAQAVLGGRF